MFSVAFLKHALLLDGALYERRHFIVIIKFQVYTAAQFRSMDSDTLERSFTVHGPEICSGTAPELSMVLKYKMCSPWAVRGPEHWACSGWTVRGPEAQHHDKDAFQLSYLC